MSSPSSSSSSPVCCSSPSSSETKSIWFLLLRGLCVCDCAGPCDWDGPVLDDLLIFMGNCKWGQRCVTERDGTRLTQLGNRVSECFLRDTCVTNHTVQSHTSCIAIKVAKAQGISVSVSKSSNWSSTGHLYFLAIFFHGEQTVLPSHIFPKNSHKQYKWQLVTTVSCWYGYWYTANSRKVWTGTSVNFEKYGDRLWSLWSSWNIILS